MQEYYEQLIASSAEEARDDYMTSMKQAILDYVLSNPLERQRLGLEGLQPLLVPRGPDAGATADADSSAGVLGRSLAPVSHSALVQRQLPPEWHEHVAMARSGMPHRNCCCAEWAFWCQHWHLSLFVMLQR